MEGSPTHDRLPVPEGLDVDTLKYVLVEIVARTAMDFGISPEEMPEIDLDSVESIDAAIDQLESRIEQSGRDSAEKQGAIGAIKAISDQLHEAIRQTQAAEAE